MIPYGQQQSRALKNRKTPLGSSEKKGCFSNKSFELPSHSPEIWEAFSKQINRKNCKFCFQGPYFLLDSTVGISFFLLDHCLKENREIADTA